MKQKHRPPSTQLPMTLSVGTAATCPPPRHPLSFESQRSDTRQHIIGRREITANHSSAGWWITFRQLLSVACGPSRWIPRFPASLITLNPWGGTKIVRCSWSPDTLSIVPCETLTVRMGRGTYLSCVGAGSLSRHNGRWRCQSQRGDCAPHLSSWHSLHFPAPYLCLFLSF